MVLSFLLTCSDPSSSQTSHPSPSSYPSSSQTSHPSSQSVEEEAQLGSVSVEYREHMWPW